METSAKWHLANELDGSSHQACTSSESWCLDHPKSSALKWEKIFVLAPASSILQIFLPILGLIHVGHFLGGTFKWIKFELIWIQEFWVDFVISLGWRAYMIVGVLGLRDGGWVGREPISLSHHGLALHPLVQPEFHSPEH